MGQFGLAEVILSSSLVCRGFGEVWGQCSSSSSVGAVCVQYHGVLLPCCQSGGWECRHRIPKSSSQSIPAFPQPRDMDKGGSSAVGHQQGVFSAVGYVILAMGCGKGGIQCYGV